MPSPTNEILISLGFDFSALTEDERQHRLPGLHEAFGYIEAFAFLADCVDHFMEAVCKEYPEMAGPNTLWCWNPDRVTFWGDYHSGKFEPGGVLAYDASAAILAELADHPADISWYGENENTLSLTGATVAQRVGQAAYQRLKVHPYKPVSVEDLLKTLLKS